MKTTDRTTRRIGAMIAASGRMTDGFMELKKKQAEVPLYQKFDFSTMQEIREVIVRAQMRGEQLYFAAEEKSDEPQLVFPTHYNGQRFNVVNPAFREVYSRQ